MAEQLTVIEHSIEEELVPLYSICTNKAGEVFAVRSITPRFCFKGSNAIEVVETAEKALDDYEAWKNNDGA